MPPAGRQLQRGSPDLHGCWMLPKETKSAPKTRVVEDDSDPDSDSDEEVEKAVIRIGSGFQAIIPEKREPGRC